MKAKRSELANEILLDEKLSRKILDRIGRINVTEGERETIIDNYKITKLS